MQAYTRRLCAMRLTTPPAWDVAFIALPGKTTILRDLWYTTEAADTGGSFGVRVWSADHSVWWYLIRAASMTVPTVHFELRQEILPGETVEASSSSTPWSLFATGYVFG